MGLTQSLPLLRSTSTSSVPNVMSPPGVTPAPTISSTTRVSLAKKFLDITSSMVGLAPLSELKSAGSPNAAEPPSGAASSSSVLPSGAKRSLGAVSTPSASSVAATLSFSGGGGGGFGPPGP